MANVTSTLHEALAIATSVKELMGLECVEPTQQFPSSKIPAFSSPEPLTSQLEELGLTHHVALRMSDAYLRNAEAFKISSEDTLRIAYGKLTRVPRDPNYVYLEKLQQRFFDVHHHTYMMTLSRWAQETIELTRSHLARSSKYELETSSIKPRQKFKSEYLPLFEFAFEKDRFPHREDKKHLAKISGMSYRQVSVWFQNRRCRHPSRVKPHHSTPPQIFEEVTEQLSTSAHENLLRFPSTLQKSTSTNVPDSSCALIQSIRNVPPLNCSTKVGTVLLQSRHRAASLGVSEVSELGLVSRLGEQYESDNDDNDTNDSSRHGAMLSFSPTLSQMFSNPLNPLKTLAANVFPAVYEPSKSTSDPFVIEHKPWPRSTRRSCSRELIDPTPETLEDLMASFHNMEVDIPMSDAGHSTSSNETYHESVLRLDISVFNKDVTPPSSLRIPPNTHYMPRRTFSASSSASSCSWSSSASMPLSRSTSYSNGLSSIMSSPHPSEASLPTRIEYAVEVTSDHSLSTVSSPSADEESECDTLADDEGPKHGSFDLLSMQKPTSKARVDAWMTDMSTQQEQEPTPSKWEQLIAAAAEAFPVQTFS